MSHRRVFLDSSFWIGLRDERETKHARAVEVAAGLLKQRVLFVITPLVLAEAHAYFCRSAPRRRQILEDVEGNPTIACEPLTPALQADAIHLLRQHRDKTYSFCDAVSFVLMRRLGLKHAATFDEHFRQFGEFEVIC